MTTAILTPEQAFLDAICETPADVGPRLVYADWLEERAGEGDKERAEFIRAQYELESAVCYHHAKHGTKQCADVRRCKEAKLRQLGQELLDAHGEGWRWEFALAATPVPADPALAFAAGMFAFRVAAASAFRRGFVESVTLTAADWLAHGPRLVRAAPLREVRLTTALELDYYSQGPVGEDGLAAVTFRFFGKPAWHGRLCPPPPDARGRHLPDPNQLLGAFWPKIRFHLAHESVTAPS